MRAFRYATYIYCVPTARWLSILPILPAIDMAGYPIKPLWGFALQVVSILAKLDMSIEISQLSFITTCCSCSPSPMV